MAKNKEISAKDWLKRISRAKKFRDQVRDKQGWERILDEYKGDYKINNQSVKAPPINIVFGYVHTAIPKLYFKDPHATVNAKGITFVQRAHILETVLNYFVKELGLKKEVAKVLMDTLLIGHGWLKFGYAGEVGEMSSPKENPSGEQVENVNEFIKSEEVFVCHVPWEDILFDVTLCKDPPYDCRWIAHRIIKPVDAMKKSEMYKNTSKIKPNISAKDARGEKIDEALKDSDLDLFEFWEIWDKDSNKIICVGEGVEGFLREDDNTYEMEGLPFSMLKFNPMPGEPYPLSDIFIIEPQILERIKLRSAQLNHVKRWSRQLSIEKGAMSIEEMEKFSQGVDGAVTQREKGSNPPVPIQYAPMQEEIFMLDDMIQRDMDAVIGQNDVERGGQARTKTKTKFELQEQQLGVMGRTAARQDKLEDFLEEVLRKLVALLKQFQTTPKYVRITGMKPEELRQKMGDVQFDGTGINFTREDIQGEYDVDVKAGSTLPMNKEGKLKLIETLITQGPALGFAPGSPVAMALTKELIRELDLKEAEKALEEQEQQMAQAKMAQMIKPVPMLPMPAGPQVPQVRPPVQPQPAVAPPVVPRPV